MTRPMATSVRPVATAGAGPPAPDGPGRRWPPIAVIAAVVAVAAVVGAHLALMAPLRVPVIHPDELGYVQNAHYLARGGLRPTTEYYPGYSLLLVPLWWISRDPLTVWRGALVVNAVLAGAGVVLAWCLVGRLAPGLDRPWRALLVAAVAAYPAVLLFSDFSMAETAFAAAFLGVCLLAARAFEASAAGPAPGWGRWAALGVGCGLIALVHPRGYAVYVAAGLLGVVALARSGRRALRPLAGLTAGLAVGFAVTRLLVVHLKDPASRFTAYSPGGILSRATTVHGALNLLSEAGGQLFYLSVATLGLVPFGLWLALRALGAAAAGDRRPAVMTRAFCGLAFLGVWAISSLFINLGTRADKLIYGRYNDAAVAPLLIIALAELTAGRTRLRTVATWAAVGVTALVGSAAFTGLGHPGAELHGPLNPVNVIAIVPYITHFGGKIEVLALLGVGLAGLAVLAALALRWPAVATLALAAGFVALAVRTQAIYILPGSRARAAQNAVPLALAALRSRTSADLSCVAWDNPAGDDFALYATEFTLPEQRIRPFGAGVGGPCGPVVASPDPHFAARFPGARLITTDPYAQVSLWALPGTPTAAALDAAGWLLPAAPAPLPAAARTDTLAVASPPSTVVRRRGGDGPRHGGAPGRRRPVADPADLPAGPPRRPHEHLVGGPPGRLGALAVPGARHVGSGGGVSGRRPAPRRLARRGRGPHGGPAGPFGGRRPPAGRVVHGAPRPVPGGGRDVHRPGHDQPGGTRHRLTRPGPASLRAGTVADLHLIPTIRAPERHFLHAGGVDRALVVAQTRQSGHRSTTAAHRALSRSRRRRQSG